MKRIWKHLRNIFVVFGCLLGFFALIELLRAYNILYDFKPWAGYTYALIVLTGIIWGVFCWWKLFNKYPLMPKPLKEALTEGAQKQHVRFLIRYITALSRNPRWNEEEKRKLVDEKDRLEGIRDEVPLADIDQVYNLLDGYVQTIREDAEQEVRRCSRDVMIFVALSPWHSVDLLVVLYRNYKMVSRIEGLYRSSPRIRDQVNILMDLGAVVATVNILNFGGKLASGLLSRVPVLGKFADDIAQGFGASLFTSVMGHAAIDRLQSFRCWNETEASKTMTSSLIRYVGDLTKVLRDDVLCLLKKVISGQGTSPVGDDEWETMCSDVENVIETTAEETTADILKRKNGFLRIGEGAAVMVHSGHEMAVAHVKKAGDIVAKASKKTASAAKVAGNATAHGFCKAGESVKRAGLSSGAMIGSAATQVTKRFKRFGGEKRRMSNIDEHYKVHAEILGDPIHEERDCPDRIGRYRTYKRGSIHYHPNLGAWETHGGIRDVWAEQGWENGWLGYPVTDEEELSTMVLEGRGTDSTTAGRISYFQNGAIYWVRESDSYGLRQRPGGDVYNNAQAWKSVV